MYEVVVCTSKHNKRHVFAMESAAAKFFDSVKDFLFVAVYNTLDGRITASKYNEDHDRP